MTPPDSARAIASPSSPAASAHTPRLRWQRALQIALLAIIGAGNAALALKPATITPQGEVARVREFVVKFDKPAVTAGNPGAQAPFTLQCQGGNGVAIPKHHGAWRNATTWAADFEDHLPPDVRCTATSTAGFKSPEGEALPATNVQFKTGAPFVQYLQPSAGQIAEDQIFIARFNGDVDAASVQTNAWCAVEGLGEKVPTEQVTGTDRDALLKSQHDEEEAAKSPNRFVLLRCKRTLPPDAKVTLHLGAYKGSSGSVNANPQSWDFQVRPPLQASFSCERPNAEAPCMPIRPLTVSFSAPVPMQLARQVVLQHGKDTIQPTFTPDEEKAATTEAVRFTGLLPEQTALRVLMPADMVDDAGRKLDNASTFPLTVQTGPMPSLLKFAASPFGVIERFAEGENGPALLPLTVRKVEAALKVQDFTPTGTVQDLSPKTDADIIRWYQRVQKFNDETIARTDATAAGVKNLPAPLPKPAKKAKGEADEEEEEGWRIPDDRVETRMVSLLAGEKAATSIKLPESDAKDPRPFEVIGMPLEPGFHVIEAASPLLGAQLLDTRHTSARTMYVRTSVLVTNLGVHFKRGRTDALVWVTTLDTGKPVADAAVAISDKNGKLLASGKTDANGVWHHPQPLPRSNDYDDAVFVSARKADAKGTTDMAFVWSDWNRGIEPWRFNAPVSTSLQPDHVAHSVLDRSLLRAGETVSMKHFFREETPKGLGAARHNPETVRLVHTGTDEKTEMPLTWRRTSTGGFVAESQWQIPKTAKLGVYRIELVGKDAKGATATFTSGNFRVEEFRLPTMRGSITPVDKPPLVALSALPVQVQLAYVNGGAAAGLPVQVSASARKGYMGFADHDGFTFTRHVRSNADGGDSDESEVDREESNSGAKLLADRLPLTLDKDGTGKLTIEKLPQLQQPLDVTLEASYSDPNGEVQTLQSRNRIWSAAVIAGIKAEDWISVRDKTRIQALALDVQGKPKSGVKMEVRAVLHTTVSSRKRLVGGFYAYDNQSSSKDLGQVCSGSTDSRGLLLCNADIKETGEVELIASAADEAGRKTEASTTVNIVREEDLWFGGNNSDRMDVLPEKRDYQPGETAQLQVRMPFRQATALVTVEREGVLHSEIVQLNGQDPVVSLKIQEDWGPNVYVNVMALRGRVRDVPWYSFFTWGFKSPITWWHAWRESGKDYAPPTAMVDLSKPAFRVGMAPIRVGVEGKGLNIKVQADRESYQVREQAKVTIEAKLPNGQPAANAEVALAAVDEALLELRGNSSWDLLHAMYADRAWGVETSTAQMEIVGRRHYGRKAVAAGGDGGQGGHTRELLDTLLLWNPSVQLDAQGKATINVPLNDALTSFRIVAVGNSGQDLFGTGHTNIRTTQDLQIISGLPPLVREGDQYRAQITLRNTTKKDMQVQVTPKASGMELKPQTVAIPAGGAHEMAWDVTAPPQLAFMPDQKIDWEIAAQDTAGSNAKDALKFSQRIVPAVPVTVQQASLVQIDGSTNLNFAPPPQSLLVFDGTAARGGVKVSLQPTLAAGLPGVRDWFINYPYYCLEQRMTKAVGLRDTAMWQSLMAELPNYLDADGLASYFPPQDGSKARGSDTLTAYLLAVTHEATTLDKRWALPAAQRDAMLNGLSKFVQGRIERKFWSPKPDRDVRKLAAIEALSRYGKATPAMLSSIELTPNLWPTHAVIDWFNILNRMTDVPERDKRLEDANQILRSRLSVQGTRMAFSTEADDYWWWLMQNGDVNAARLILAVLNQPSWQGDMGALASGFIGRQQSGAWRTTTANLWGGLALEKFSAKFESTPVAGQTAIKLGSESATIDWTQVKPAAAASSAAPSRRWFGAPPAAGMLTNNSALLPWQNAPGGKPEQLTLQQNGSGKPWATIQSLAAVPLTAPLSAGYVVKKTITPVQEAVKGKVTRGDVWRIKLEITANADMTWVAISDPVPGGATILGSGLGRDSSIATEGEKSGGTSGGGWLAYIERAFEAWRAYYEYLPKGKTTIEYTVRLNNAGTFTLPPTRAEALYAPEIFGAAPNPKLTVQNAP